MVLVLNLQKHKGSDNHDLCFPLFFISGIEAIELYIYIAKLKLTNEFITNSKKTLEKVISNLHLKSFYLQKSIAIASHSYKRFIHIIL